MRTPRFRVEASTIVLLALATLGANPETGPNSPPAATSTPRAGALQRFQDGKLGLSIHWGVSALLGKGEWVMERDKLPIAEYEKLPPRFNPSGFDAETWVKAAEAAGAKYLTVTAKGPDGFCLFETKQTRFDIVDGSPFGKDPVKLLAEACRKHAIPLYFSYSLLDWHHPDYFPLGQTGHATGREETGRWARYVAYCQAQLRELCTQYGEIGGIWLVGQWDRPEADWDLERTYKIVHELQPAALVGNDRRLDPQPGQDVRLLLPDARGEAPRPAESDSNAVPLVLSVSINESWGFDARDTRRKSAAQLVHQLIEAAGRGANLELAVAVRPDGTLGPEITDRLQELGKWLEKYGETVYGTQSGPVPPQPWGVSTSALGRAKLPQAFLHVLKPEAGPIRLPESILSCVPRVLGGIEPLKVTQTREGIVVELPERDRLPVDTIVVLTPKVFVPERPSRNR